MDLSTVTRIIPARQRSDLDALGPTVVPLAGGSELFADPRAHLEALVDLQAFGWAALTITDDDGAAGGGARGGAGGGVGGGAGLEIAATCTFAELARLPQRAGWAAHPLFYQCCTALFGSFKVWNVATVGGNLATSLPAGPMITLAVALDAELLVWRGDGSDEVVPARSFVTGNMTNVLGATDVLRSIRVPLRSLQATTAYRKIALSPLGRSGAVLAGRRDTAGTFVLTVTAATLRPVQLRYPAVPSTEVLARDIDAIDCWFTDAHGAADWRRAMGLLLGEEIRSELALMGGRS